MLIERVMAGRTIRVECAEVHARRAGAVLDTLARLAADGGSITAGTQLRFGWALLRLEQDDTALRLCEPDFAHWPDGPWQPTLDVTLEVLTAQTSLLHRLGFEGEDVFCDQYLIAAADTLDAPHIFLRRAGGRSHADSGWLLASLDDPEALARDDVEAVLVAHLVKRRPALLQALTLPADSIVLFSGDSLVQVYDATGRERLAGADIRTPFDRGRGRTTGNGRDPTSG